MDPGARGRGTALAYAASIAFHAALFFFLGVLPSLKLGEQEPVSIDMEIIEPPPVPIPEPPPEPEAPEPEAPPPEPEPEPEPERPRPVPVAAPEPPPPPEAPPPPAAETIEEFAGVTLTNDGPGVGWASQVGNNQAITAPIGAPGRPVTGRNREGVPGGEIGGTGNTPATARVVPLGDLSRPPRPPDLNATLEQNYPRQARLDGVEGEAVVRARIRADGAIERIRIVSQTLDGFGGACRRTLEGSQWSPPLDRDGRAVSTEISYTCRFQVRY